MPYISMQMNGGLTNLLGIYDREKGLKISAFEVIQRYDSRERFVIADTKLGKSGGEIFRVTREKVTMDTVERIVDLQPSL
jgi:hypothetical protein